MRSVLVDVVVSISELEKDPSAVVVRAGGIPVAVLSRNRVIGYMVPSEFYEQMMEHLDDLGLVGTSKARSTEMPIPMILDDL